MNLSRIFIERPVMTALVSFAILIFGVVAFRALPVAALPSVDYPTISVSAVVPGASPETMASSVATPLEREFSTIAGISSMNSVNSQGARHHHGSVRARPQDRRGGAGRSGGDLARRRTLPTSMPRPPSYQKVNPGRAAGSVSRARLADAADVHGERVRRHAAGAADLDGERRVARAWSSAHRNTPFACRWIPTSSRRTISASMKCSAPSQTSNTNLPTGRLDGDKQAFTIQSNGTLSNAAAFRPVIVAWRNGTPVRLEQLANVIDGVENDKLAAWYNNKRAVILAVQKQPGTNTVEVVDSIRELLPEFRREHSADRQSDGRVRRVAVHSRLHPRRGVHAGSDHRARGAGDLSVPAEPLGHDHSRAARCRSRSSAHSR